MSVICQNFVQNAWRKDLCSNCFKSEADHSTCAHRSIGNTGSERRYVPQAATLYQSRGLSMNLHWRPLLANPASKIQDRISCRDFGSQTSIAEANSRRNEEQTRTKGILKDKTLHRKPRRSSVGFVSEEPLVIGFGGRDYDSDDSPWELGSDDGSINLELLDFTDEDRTITKLTKNNTEFNSVNENLIVNPSRGDTYSSPEKAVLNNQNIWKQDTPKSIYQTSNVLSTTQSDTRPQNYYYSTKNELVESYLPKISETTRYLTECNEMSLIAKDIPGIISNIQNNSGLCKKVDNINEMRSLDNTEYISKTLQGNECQNISSSRYLLITRVQDSCSSDSDYSTSKQTNGESSTDTESFHDAEDTMLVSPCSSFLHGSAVRSTDSCSRTYVSKAFETSSVSSTDTSTFSDDSDSQKPKEEIISNKSKNIHSKNSTSSNAIKNIAPDSQNKYKALPIKIKDETKTRQISNYATVSAPSIPSTKDNLSCNGTSESRQEAEPKIMETRPGDSTKMKSVEKLPSSSNQCSTSSEHEKTRVLPHVEYSKYSTSNNSNSLIKERAKANTEKCNAPADKPNANNRNNMSTNQASPQPENESEISKTEFHRNNKTSDDKINCGTKSNISTFQQEPINTNSGTSCEDSCKKWMTDGDEWKSVKRTPQSTPSVSSTTTTDTEDHLDSMHSNVCTPESNGSSARNSPNSKSNRESKLAALALELEKVRCDASATKERKSHDDRYSTPQSKNPSKEEIEKKSRSEPSQSTSGKYPSIRRGRSIVSSNQTPKSSLPDLLPETKVKKNRFSLKKLLKRGKDSDTLVINNPNDYNPKAWKRQTFDRSRLSLEIVHPMDLASDPTTSDDNTPTEDKRASIFSNPSGRHHARTGAVATRARSLSALPQLCSLVSEISDPEGSGLRKDDSSSLDRPRMDMPRKAGTVAERSKKYKAPRRTPSFSELRSASTSSGRSTAGGAPSERPPKPPPPPRGKSLPPPQPPKVPPPIPQEKSKIQVTAPTRPPPPKLQEENESSSTGSHGQDIGDYANLGDIRLNIIPKKPQRPSAISFARDTLETDEQQQSLQPSHSRSLDNTYEAVGIQEEEDHYTYLDDTEAKTKNLQKRSKDCSDPQKIQISVTCAEWDKKTPSPTTNPICSAQRPSVILKKPWMNLHASYAAIAAANYESLTELITTAISEGLEKFQKTASTLKWSDFELESEDAIQTLDDKLVYNAVYKSQPKTKVTLMVTTQKQHTTQGSNRNPCRPPVLAAFSEILPIQITVNENIKYRDYNNTQKAMVYVLQRSRATTVNQFALNSASFQANQHVHLRNACFVLLQLIHTLKSLQAEGIEEIDYDLSRILLLHTDVDKPPILVLLPGDKVFLTMTDFYKADVATRKTTLCQTTLQLLFELLQIKSPTELTSCMVNGESLASAVAHTFGVIAKVLSEEKASSLTQAKGLLEYMLWGPVDIKTSAMEEDIDVVLQRWLDLQRAQMVKSLISNLHLKISSHTGFHVYEEYKLIFLLQATVRSLKDIIYKL